MRAVFVVIAIVVSGCTASAEDQAVGARQHCVDLRDHLVDIRLKDVADPAVDVAAHRAAMQQALGDHFVVSCLKDLSETQAKCVMAATDSESVTACSNSK